MQAKVIYISLQTTFVSFRSLLFSVLPFGVGVTVSGCGRAGRNREGTRFFYKVYLINIII